MAIFSETIASLSASGDDWIADPSADWRQGRTLFGGLSAALCLAACERAVPDLPPLRAAQIAFIAPTAGEVRMQVRVMRRGKSVSFLGCDLIAEGSVAVRTLFAFGAARPSLHSASAGSAPEGPAPEACGPLFAGPQGPDFTAHIDQRFVRGSRPVSGAANGDLTIWVRHRDPAPVSPLVGLLALGDALPPATMTRFQQPAAISTMTWGLDLIAPENVTGGWYLLRATDDAVGGGYSGQAMTMWDETGAPVMIGRQSVAVFT
jgi:acyl-CoA thioesterase